MFWWLVNMYSRVRDYLETNESEIVRRVAPLLAYLCFGIAVAYAVLFLRQITKW